jgi:hypothetical protein
LHFFFWLRLSRAAVAFLLLVAAQPRCVSAVDFDEPQSNRISFGRIQSLTYKNIIMEQKTARKLALGAAGVLLASALAWCVFVVWMYLRPQFSGLTTAAPSAAEEAAPAPPPAGRIKVGYLLSDFTAAGPHWRATPYGYDDQTRALVYLRDPAIELIPVLEPGTANNGALPAILARYFVGEKPLDATQSADLRGLQVLVAIAAHNASPKELSAIEDAVSHGVGLLRGSLGTVSPGFTPQVQRLAGLTNAGYAWNGTTPTPCVVMAASPLLGDLQRGQTIHLLPNGVFGNLTGTPLLRVRSMAQMNYRGQPAAPGQFLYPLYTSQLGQGRIVGLGFAQYQEIPEELADANHGRFYVHCVQWLAGRPVQ